MRVLILGAGVVGVTAAWYLAQEGHEVTVVDRHAGAALETSFANGGQISASYAEPWANPDAPLKILKWLGQEDAPLLFRLRLDPAQWRWGLQFLIECLPSRTRRNTIQCLNLALYSRDCLKELRAQTGIEYDHLERGILSFYTDPVEYEHGVAAAALMRQFGCDRDVKTVAECVAIEPALAGCRDRLAGGIFTASDESGDAQRFTQELARMAAARGVTFRWNMEIASLTAEGDAMTGVRCGQRRPPQGNPHRRRLRDGDGELQPVHAAASRRALPHLSGEGLLGDDPHRRTRRRPHGFADGSRVEDCLHAPGRPPAGGRHRRAVRVQQGPEPRPLRGVGQADFRALSGRRRPRKRAILDGLAPPPRHRMCRCWGAPGTATCFSIPATGRWGGRWHAAPGAHWQT